VLPWLALLFPIPNTPGGPSSPNLSAGSSFAQQVLGLDSRTNGGWLLGCIWGQRRKWGVLVGVFQFCSCFCDLPPCGFPFDFKGLARCSVPLGGLLFGSFTQYSHPHLPVWLSRKVLLALAPVYCFAECPVAVTLTPGLCPTREISLLVVFSCVPCHRLCPSNQPDVAGMMGFLLPAGFPKISRFACLAIRWGTDDHEALYK